MVRLIVISIWSFLFSFVSYANEDSKQCTNFYKSKNFKKALPYCLKSPKGNEFRLGYIYETLNKCSSSKEWYIKDNSSAAFTNLGINYFFGQRGCKYNLSNAKRYFKKANSVVKYCPKYNLTKKILECEVEEVKSNIGYYAANYYLAMVEMEENQIIIPNIVSFKYLIKGIANTPFTPSDFSKSIVKGIDDTLKKYLKNGITTDDSIFILETFYEPDSDIATFQWFHENFDIIIKNASYQIQSFEDFVKDKWLFTLEARMSQLGFGKIQDLEDSYRVYLIEAKNGNKYAIKWRDELKEKLSETSINLATCLAKKAKRNKKGVYEYPNWFSKLMC